MLAGLQSNESSAGAKRVPSKLAHMAVDRRPHHRDLSLGQRECSQHVTAGHPNSNSRQRGPQGLLRPSLGSHTVTSSIFYLLKQVIKGKEFRLHLMKDKVSKSVQTSVTTQGLSMAPVWKIFLNNVSVNTREWEYSWGLKTKKGCSGVIGSPVETVNHPKLQLHEEEKIWVLYILSPGHCEVLVLDENYW